MLIDYQDDFVMIGSTGTPYGAGGGDAGPAGDGGDSFLVIQKWRARRLPRRD